MNKIRVKCVKLCTDKEKEKNLDNITKKEENI